MALFLRKERKREWSEGGSAAADGGLGVEDGADHDGAVQLMYPEVISSLDEIHSVGTLAQVWCFSIFHFFGSVRFGPVRF